MKKWMIKELKEIFDFAKDFLIVSGVFFWIIVILQRVMS